MTKKTNDPTAPPSDPRSAWLALWEHLSASLDVLRGDLSAAAGRHHLSLEASLALYYLGCGNGDRLNQRQLAAWVRVSPAKMSGLLESLRQRQIVFSQRTDQDRRNQIWSLTTAGQRLLQLLLADLEMVPALVQQLDQRLESVPRLVRLLAEDPSAGDGQRPSQQEGRAA